MMLKFNPDPRKPHGPYAAMLETTDKTKREVHLEALLTMALPYLERVELGTSTSVCLRALIDEIREEVA